MNIFNTNLQAYENLKSKIEFYEKLIAGMPAGSISTSRRKNGTVFYQYVNGKKKYISSDDKNSAISLLKKRYYLYLLNDAKNEAAALELYLKHHKDSTADKFLIRNEAVRNIIFSERVNAHELLNNNEWLAKVAKDPAAYKLLRDHILQNGWDYSGASNVLFPEKRTIKTMCGVKVRSKSEMIIANELYYGNYLFIYEPEIIINGIHYYPDFVVFHPINGRLIIIEHGGLFYDKNMLSDYDNDEKHRAFNYTNDFARKIKEYISAGWVPGVNLILTGETKFEPFDASVIKTLLNEYLN